MLSIKVTGLETSPVRTRRCEVRDHLLVATTLHLVRHAEPGNDRTLSDRGCVQAGLIGRRLSGLGIEAVLHGPSARTRQTAQHLATAVPAARVQESVLLDDLTPTPARGEEDSYPPRLRAWMEGVDPAERDPGGVRLTQAFEHFAAAGGPTVLVTHAFVVGWFVRTAIEAPVHRWMELFPDHASLTTIAFRDDGRPPSLVRFNDTGHLG